MSGGANSMMWGASSSWMQCCGSMTFWEWIRIRGSMPLTNGSGFASWIRILLFSSLTFKMPAENKIFNTIFSAYYFLKVQLHHFSKIKSQKESQNSRNQGFSYYFCMMIEGSGSIPLTSGSGSQRIKNMWIRNTAWMASSVENAASRPRWTTTRRCALAVTHSWRRPSAVANSHSTSRPWKYIK